MPNAPYIEQSSSLLCHLPSLNYECNSRRTLKTHTQIEKTKLWLPTCHEQPSYPIDYKQPHQLLQQTHVQVRKGDFYIQAKKATFQQWIALACGYQVYEDPFDPKDVNQFV